MKKPVSGCFGSAHQCCCCITLSAAAIIFTVLEVLSAVFVILEKISALSIIQCILHITDTIVLIVALKRKDGNIMIVASALYVVIYFVGLADFILKMANLPANESTMLAAYVVIWIIYTCLMLYFLKIHISLANVYIVNGTGWERKNWMEIEKEKETHEVEKEEKE